MKKFITILNFAFFASSIQAQNGLERMVVEEYYVSDANDATGSIGALPIGSVTYRVYADMLPGYKFQMAYGSPTHLLKILTNTTFFNNEDRGAATSGSISVVNTKKNTVMLDSWFSVGATAVGKMGVLKSDDSDGSIGNSNGILQNADANAGIAIKTEDGMVAGSPQSVTFVGFDPTGGVFDAASQFGNSFTTSNGAWSSLNGSVGANSDTNRVLIGQFTTAGTFTFELNVQIGTPGGGTEQYVAKNPKDKEILMPSLIYTSSGSKNIAPAVSITAPLNNVAIAIGDTVTITANASDVDGSVVSVEFFVNGVSVGTDLSAPYSFKWKSVMGNANLTAVATDNLGAKDTSAIIQISVSPAGITDLNAVNSFKVFPVPAKDELNIMILTSTGNNADSYSIYNMEGKVVFHKVLNSAVEKQEEKIDLSSFENGQYIIQLSRGSSISSKTIIKNQ